MLSYAQYNCVYFCDIFTIIILIINVSSCPIIIEQPSLTISQLSIAARAYFNLGISNSTRKAYTAGIHKYTAFCFQINRPPIPVCEDTLMLFVTYLAQQNLSYATTVYTSVPLSSEVWWHHICQDYYPTNSKTELHIKGYMQGECCKPSA